MNENEPTAWLPGCYWKGSLLRYEWIDDTHDSLAFICIYLEFYLTYPTILVFFM